jgi:hypothetical protein
VQIRRSRFTAIGNAWTRRLFDGPFYLSAAPRDGVPVTGLVFVRSRDGNTVAKDPGTLGGGEADRHLVYEGLYLTTSPKTGGEPNTPLSLEAKGVARRHGTGPDAGVVFEHCALGTSLS